MYASPFPPQHESVFMAGDWLQQFVNDGTISADQLREAEEMASSLGIPVESALVKLEYVA